MGQTIELPVTLTQISCGVCGGSYAINERYRQHKYENGESWNCPYCRTGWGYQKSQIKELEEKLAQERKKREWAEQNNKVLSKNLEAEQKRSKKLKKRVAAGVCPCCNRTFKQLSQHMKTKHPEYKDE